MTKERKTQLIHVGILVATAVIGAVVDHLTKSHAVWAPVATAVLLNLRSLLPKVPQ